MGKSILYLLAMLSCISTSCLSGHASGKTIYVSSSTGSNENDGLTPQSPVKTIAEALRKGDTIRLKRGDVFFESIKLNKKYCLAYGQGEKPVIAGWKRIEGDYWEECKNNIWRICLTDGKRYSGFQIFGSSNLNNIGCIHEYQKDEIHGRRVQRKADLKVDWDFYQTYHHDKKEVTNHDFDTLYLYSHDNPNYLNLEFSVAEAAVRICEATIDNIRMEGFGFGISAMTGSIIRNCDIDAIGGMMAYTASEFVSYGNGVEFYISKDVENCVVENCIISRCYDCGVSIQASGQGQAQPRNIIIRNNLIERCCQGWEDFLRNDSNILYKNCRFENNVVLNSGNTSGFGYPESRFKFCHVLGNNTQGNKGMIIRNNTFVGGNYYCSGAYQGEYKSNVWEGNTCVIKRGDYILSNYMGTKDVIRIPKDKGDFASISEATDDAIRRYRKLTGDETTKFIIKDEKTINRQISKLKKKYLRKKK